VKKKRFSKEQVITGVTPGIAMAIVLAVIARLIAGRRAYPVHPAIGVRETGRRFLLALPALCPARTGCVTINSVPMRSGS
jgi:hypothetical protein